MLKCVNTDRIPNKATSGEDQEYPLRMTPEKPIVYMHAAKEGLSRHTTLQTKGISEILSVSIFFTFKQMITHGQTVARQQVQQSSHETQQPQIPVDQVLITSLQKVL